MDHSNAFPDEHSECALVTSSSPTALLSPRQREGLNPQSRRLQLRNAGFRGTFIPPRRISPIFRSQPYSEPSSTLSNENLQLSPERRTLHGEDVPQNSVNILREIHNSARQKKKSTRPGLGTIFQDQTATASNDSLSGRSWYNESSNNCSPASINASPTNMMKSHEAPLSHQTPPPLSSPLAKQIKGRNAGPVSNRSSSFEATRYIEHLESQLSSLNAKLDSLVSPNTSKARAAKLRSLTAEIRSLRQELADWEKSFEERVKDGIEQGLEVEAGLRSRLLAAEDDVQIRDIRIKELEFELETLRLKLKDTENLEITNANLEKRIDVLTSLLVQSPTKLEFGSAASSPGKIDPQKRILRPRSMLPKLPSSPGGARLSLSTIGEASFWNSGALRSDSSISESPEQLCSDDVDKSPESPEQIAYSQHSGPFDTDSGNSGSHRSVPSISSRPTSLHSSSSFGASSWGLPLSSEGDARTRAASRQRRMRRFPSGSSTLKPLILPNGAAASSLPASAPVSQNSCAGKRDLSDCSLDPTTAFLSQQDLISSECTPTQPQRRRPNSWAQEQALRSLEGRSNRHEEFVEPAASSTSSPTLRQSLVESNSTAGSPKDKRSRSRPRSLQEELKQAFLEASYASYTESVRDGLVPLGDSSGPAERSPSRNHTVKGNQLISSGTKMRSSATNQRQRHTDDSGQSTPKTPTKTTTIMSQVSKSLPLRSTAESDAPSLPTRLTSVLSLTKQNPTRLAQRLLYNAWALGAARLGGIGWWLLGVLFGSRTREERKADEVVGESEQARVGVFDWRPYSAKASRQRTGQCFLNSQRAQKSPADPIVEDSERDLWEEPHAFPCEACEEPSSRRTFRLWFQFSLTVVLAVGVAMRYGPEALLKRPTEAPSGNQRHLVKSSSSPSAAQKGHDYGSTRPKKPHLISSKPITFAPILGPADFDGRSHTADNDDRPPL